LNIAINGGLIRGKILEYYCGVDNIDKIKTAICRNSKPIGSSCLVKFIPTVETI